MIPTRLGQKVEGGFFTGINRIGQVAYAIIVDPKSLQAQLEIKTAFSATPNTQSVNDGWANTTNMDNINHPAARYCRTLTAGGYTDRHLPSRNELELCYRYLKPTANSNAVYSAKTFSGNLGLENGTTLLLYHPDEHILLLHLLKQLLLRSVQEVPMRSKWETIGLVQNFLRLSSTR